MPRTTDLTIRDIEVACGHIRDLGQRPTVNRVRAILKKGSATTIARLLKEHLKDFEANRDEIKIDVPQDALLKFKEAVGIATNEREEIIGELKKELVGKNGHIEEILGEMEEKEVELQSAENQKMLADEKLEALIREAKDLHLQNQELAKEIKLSLKFKEALIAEKSRSNTIAEQIKEYKERIKTLEGDNRSLLERALQAENKSKK